MQWRLEPLQVVSQFEKSLEVAFDLQPSAQIGFDEAEQVGMQQEFADHLRFVDHQCHGGGTAAMDEISIPEAYGRAAPVVREESPDDFPDHLRRGSSPPGVLPVVPARQRGDVLLQRVH